MTVTFSVNADLVWPNYERLGVFRESEQDGVYRCAVISECGAYRYVLEHSWGLANHRPLTFCMLNPSTADAFDDDHTVRKCTGFAKRLGFNGILVVNLFAFRATDPRGLRRAEDPVGPKNPEVLRSLNDFVVVAWGNGVRLHPRGDEMARILRLKARRALDKWWVCLGKTKYGEPRHPLMLGYNTPVEPWR